MFRNYLIVAVRNRFRHRGYSLINILGLAVGLACVTVMILYIQDELGFDGHHEKRGGFTGLSGRW